MKYQGKSSKRRAACPSVAREGASLNQALDKIARSVKGLPPDLAANHDHYLYGTPKRRKPFKVWVPGLEQDQAASRHAVDRFTNRLVEISKMVKGLPFDLAANHDCYLHGQPLGKTVCEGQANQAG